MVWDAPLVHLTEYGEAPRFNAGNSRCVLNVVRAARVIQQQSGLFLLSEHDFQVMWLAYRLACACGALSTPPHGTAEALSAEQVLWAGLLHDIGKHVIPEVILAKPGPLTAEERQVMQTHPMHGHRMARQLAEEHHISEIDRVVLQGILHHHERYDGEGYPVGLSGESIPLLARILTVMDVYAALTSPRAYHPALPPQAALDYLLEHQGTIFDPVLVRHAVRILQFH